MATKKRAAKKAVPKRKATPRKKAAAKKKSTPAKIIIKEQPPIRIIVEVVINTTGNRNISVRNFENGDLSNDFSSILDFETAVMRQVDEFTGRTIRTNPPVEIMVKTVILKIANRSGNPEQLGDDEELGDLFTSDAQYVLLRAYLEAIARLSNKQAKISLAEVLDCTTVKDCIDLVKSKM